MSKLLLVVFSLLTSSYAMASEQVKLVKSHHIVERSRTLAMKNGFLFAGRTGTQSEGANFLEVFSPETFEMVAAIRLSHSVKKVESINSCDLMVSSSQGYSVINTCDASFNNVKSYSFGLDFVPHQGTHDGQGNFVFTEPNAGMYLYSGANQRQRLGKHISMTVSMNFLSDNVWVTNYSDLTVLNPRTGDTYTVPNEEGLYGFKYVNQIDLSNGQSKIVATVRDDQAIVIVDPATRQIDQTLRIESEPEGVTTYGNCAVIASSSDKTILFVDLMQQPAQVIETWDASSAGDMLKMPSQIAVDAERQQVFLRSTYPCPTCSQTQSSIFAITNPESNIERCL